MNGNFTHKAQEAIMRAQQLAQERGQQQVDALHLLYALLSQEDSVLLILFQKVGADIEGLKKKVDISLTRLPISSAPTPFGQFYLTQDLAKTLEKAREEAGKMGDEFISVEHLFLALLDTDSKAKEILARTSFLGGGGGTATADNLEFRKLDYETTLKTLADIRGGVKITDPSPESKYQVVEKYARNLTRLAQQGKLDPVIGRENEIRRLMQVLSRRTKNNPVVIGEAGVGKTAVVEGLAQKIVKGDIPESLKEKEIIGLDLGALVAGTKYRGEFVDRIKALLKEIERGAGKYLLFIDELHTLVGAGAAEGAIDASNLLKPALARGELRAMGATTLKEYQRYIEKDPALCAVATPELKFLDEIVSGEKPSVWDLDSPENDIQCSVSIQLRELQNDNPNISVKRYSLFNAPIDIYSEMNNDGEYTLRVKGSDFDIQKPIYESKSASFKTNANSEYAIVDRQLRKMGLNPVWVMDGQIIESGEVIENGNVHLHSIMGVNEAAESNNITYSLEFSYIWRIQNLISSVY